MSSWRTLVLACLCYTCVLDCLWVQGAGLDLGQLQERLFTTIEKVRPCSVNITGGGTGFSGVIVSPDGHVLSAGHAVRPGIAYRIELPDGRTFTGIGKGSNQRLDCALIKITNPGQNLPFAPMGDSSSLRRNQPCIGLSFPSGQKAAKEPVTRFGRVVQRPRGTRMFQSSVLMEPGDSGGPLFDLNGYVIGIHSRIGRSTERNYEVPVVVFREFWNELNQQAYFEGAGPPQPKLGVRCDRAKGRDTNGGLIVFEVVDDSRADKAGVRADDVIMKVFGKPTDSRAELREALADARDAGVETISIDLVREDEKVSLQVEFDVERDGAPEVALPAEDYPTVSESEAYEELALLVDQFSDLEAKLDDACVEITSEIGDQEFAIIGTCLKGSQWIVSKSSVVGDTVRATINGKSKKISRAG